MTEEGSLRFNLILKCVVVMSTRGKPVIGEFVCLLQPFDIAECYCYEGISRSFAFIFCFFSAIPSGQRVRKSSFCTAAFRGRHQRTGSRSVSINVSLYFYCCRLFSYYEKSWLIFELN